MSEEINHGTEAGDRNTSVYKKVRHLGIVCTTNEGHESHWLLKKVFFDLNGRRYCVASIETDEGHNLYSSASCVSRVCPFFLGCCGVAGPPV